VRAILVSRRHLQVLRLLVALNDATAALLAQRLDLPVAVVELLLSELEEAGLITGDTVH
jgi:DNA-binding IclR family transcriptional regulator